MIELRNVHKRFGKQVVLDGVDFNVREGETVALLGPSGTGKSVLLKHIIGLIRPDSGTIVVDDREVGKPGRCKIATGGPEDFRRMIEELLDGAGTEFPGLRRDQRHVIRVELSQGRGAVVVKLDGHKLESSAPRRPDPRVDAGTASIVLRSFEPVRVIEATLTGKAR